MMRDSPVCPNCQRKLAAPTAEVEAVSCPECATRLQRDAPLQDAEAKVALQSTPQSGQNTSEDVNPIPRIARKRSHILRYLDPDTPITRWRRTTFLFGVALIPTLYLVCEFFSSSEQFDWRVFGAIVVFSPCCGMWVMLAAMLFDPKIKPDRSRFVIPPGHRDTLSNKSQRSSPETHPPGENVTPPPTQGTIQPDPKPEEPTDV